MRFNVLIILEEEGKMKSKKEDKRKKKGKGERTHSTMHEYICFCVLGLRVIIYVFTYIIL